MKLEIILILVVVALLYDTYYGGVFMKYYHLFRKYYKVVGVIFLIFSIYITLKKNPNHIRNMLMQSTGIPGIPTTTRLSSPSPVINLHNAQAYSTPDTPAQPTTTHTKRSVSETKKKFVAYSQQWKCKHCGNMLNAWFEVDHIQRLDQGGDNQVANLVALCRECHGKKTAVENM